MISIERVRFQQSLDALGQQGRQDFVDFLRDYHGEYLQLRVAGTGRMQQGGNIPDHNVAMSRMADMLGMKGLIAKSRKVRIKHKDGTVRSGVFQEAEEFSDAARLKAGDPIYELKNHREALNDGSLLRQIADLQVLDYVCGNNDRHLGNIMYNVQMENGVPKIVSIKGIDNDRSMGMVDDHDAGLRGYITPPVQDDKAIHYNAASAAAEPDYLRADRGQMYVSDFSTHKQELSQMLDSLKRTESIAHWNSASYDWMLDSLKNVIAGIKVMENKYTDADIPLQQEDAAKIEVLYRQMRLAASAYMREHTNPSSPMGISRRDGALSIYRLYPVKLDESRVKVREVSIDGVAAKEPAKPVPKKPGLAQTIRNAKRKAAEAQEMRGME